MSYKVYPVTQTDLNTENYEVKINGQKVQLNTARVSAMPFNRRWPGHQREISQTELVNFLSLETDEELVFEITPRQKFEKVEIRPASLGIKPEITADGKVVFTLPHAAYFTVEPYGRCNALHVFADPTGKYDINPDDENVIYYGKGEHDVGMITLGSNQTLFIDEGAVVYACIEAMDAHNIKILGRGILDNSRNREQILYESSEEGNTTAVNNAVRIHTIVPEYCTDIEIDGITIRDSLVYSIKPVACQNIRISNVKVIGNWRYNSDGIDMHNCIDVSVDNCFLRTFDDSICVKGFDCYYEGDVEAAVRAAMYRNGKSYDVFKNVRIKNCTIWNDWGKCLEIGAETRAEEMYDIVFEDCDIIHVTASVLDCTNVDYAYVHDVTYRNINIEYDDVIPELKLQTKDGEQYTISEPDFTPNVIGVMVAYHYEYSAGGTRRGKNKNIVFENINLYGRQKPIFYVRSHTEEFCSSDIVIRNFRHNGKPLSETDYEIQKDEASPEITIC